jgi:hypothetical protein
VPAVKKRGFSGRGIFAFLFLAGLVAVFYEWPSFVDAKGTAAAASVTEKRETVREHFGNWFRRFEIVAAYRAPGSAFEHHAVCDVEQATYDATQIGDRVTVHYIPALLQQPFIPATHLSPCTAKANFGSNPDLYRRMALVFGSLLPIMFLFLVLRIRIAIWLLVPWFGIFIVYCAVPRAEPAPSQPRPAQATVRSVYTIDEIFPVTSTRRRHTMPVKLDHPYQLIQVEFTPSGAASPVVALDAIDINSIAGLQPKRAVDIDYDAANPRIARLRGGTRNFPEQAQRQLLLTFGLIAGILIALLIFTRSSRLFRPKSAGPTRQ